MTFKSIVFVEAKTLRRFNQRKAVYPISLNWQKETSTLSKLLLNLINDMISMASNWEERLRSPNCDKKDDPQLWASSFLPTANSIRERRRVNTKAIITCKRPTTIWQKLTHRDRFNLQSSFVWKKWSSFVWSNFCTRLRCSLIFSIQSCPIVFITPVVADVGSSLHVLAFHTRLPTLVARQMYFPLSTCAVYRN